VHYSALYFTASFAIWPRGSGSRQPMAACVAHAVHLSPSSLVIDENPTDCALPIGPTYTVTTTLLGGCGSGRSTLASSVGGFGFFFACGAFFLWPLPFGS